MSLSDIKFKFFKLFQTNTNINSYKNFFNEYIDIFIGHIIMKVLLVDLRNI